MRRCSCGKPAQVRRPGEYPVRGQRLHGVIFKRFTETQGGRGVTSGAPLIVSVRSPLACLSLFRVFFRFRTFCLQEFHGLREFSVASEHDEQVSLFESEIPLGLVWALPFLTTASMVAPSVFLRRSSSSSVIPSTAQPFSMKYVSMRLVSRILARLASRSIERDGFRNIA